MMLEPALPLGPETVVGSYRLVKEIGRGGMATVYEARHAVLSRRAAVKIMHPELRRQPGMASRLAQEAGILEDIRHPGVVRVYECAVLPDHRPWIAMELVEGETLAMRIARGSPVSPIEVATLLAELSDVLAAVHAHGVVHRDLKPDNILLVPRDRDFPLRVIDWGVARLGPIGRITLDGLTPGTPIYMSPEQATGRDVAAPCDMYSLGVIAYEALSGRPPFDGRTLAEVVCMHLTSDPHPLPAGTPRELRDLVLRLLVKEPALRPGAIEIRQQARALVHELANAYASYELVDGARPRSARRRRAGDANVADPDSLELGITELVPTIRRPRWTPEMAISQIAPAADHPYEIRPKPRHGR
jgi:serine/threonine protein kinase